MRKLILLFIFSCLICTLMSMAHEDKVLSALVARFLHDKTKSCEDNKDRSAGTYSKRCKSPCSKGSVQVETGPFWANRGKKDPTYIQDRLFVDEPHWYVMRKDVGSMGYDPFFITRGKKTVTEVKDYVTLGKISSKKENLDTQNQIIN